MQFNGRSIECYPDIQHDVTSSYLGFVQEEAPDLYPTVHHIKIKLSIDGLLEDDSTIIPQKLQEQGFCVIEQDSDQWIEVASILVREFPERHRELMEMSWTDWLDAFDGDTYSVGLRADEVLEHQYCPYTLQDGSLFLFEDLHVHPRFRGQNIGLRLIRHLLVVLRRADGDLAILFANPRNSIYGDNSARIDNKRALAQYYERAGFTIVREDGAVLMEAHMGLE